MLSKLVFKNGEFTLIALIAAFVTDIILARDIGGFMSIMENNLKTYKKIINMVKQQTRIHYACWAVAATHYDGFFHFKLGTYFISDCIKS